MTLYFSAQLRALGICHGTTNRQAGNMRLSENTRTLFDSLSIPEEKILRFKQVHSDKIISVLCAEQVQKYATAPLLEADGWVIKGTGFGAAILTADCAPLILWDQQGEVIGLSHCGWRGVAAQLPAKTVLQMKSAGAEGPISAWIGPHIQGKHFEVQADVAAQFPGCVIPREGRLFVDLNQAILQQLAAQGLLPQDIEFCPHCTYAEPENFFSFRRDHAQDALLTFVYKPI